MQNSVTPACSGVPAVFVSAVFATLLVVSFSLLPVHLARAQDSPEDDRLTILITASRLAETVDETLAPVTVITRKEIEEKQATTVEEVLRSVPGVTLSNNGGVGKVTTLFLRGANSNHVLVLLDGVKIGSATSGLTPFQDLPLDQIEKIEVVRGPRSSLYGSEAIGGVIQIFTRTKRTGVHPHQSLGLGSHNTKKIDAGISGGGQNAWYGWNASHVSTDGFDTCRGASGGCFVDEPDDDGYENYSFSLRGGVSLSDAFSIEGNFLNSDNQTEFDGFSQNESETVTQLASVKAIWQASGRWRSSLLLGQSKDNADNFKDGVPFSTFDTTRDQIAWQNNLRLNENSRMVAGVDYLDDKVDSTDYDADKRDNTGVFALFRTSVNANDMELSLRNDDNEQFGVHGTGSVGWGRNFGKDNRITASYGTAFKAPTFNDLYGFGGDPNLEPESSRSFDLGFSHRVDNGGWAVNLFHTKIDDLIVYRARTDNGMYDGANENLEQARIIGVEFSRDAKLGEWKAAATLTRQNAEETKGDNQDEPLLKRPQQKLDLDFSRRFGTHHFGLNIFAQSRSYDFGGVDLPGFAVVNLRGKTRVHRNFSLDLKVNNLFDKVYETAYFYPQDGINFMLTLHYAPVAGH